MKKLLVVIILVAIYSVPFISKAQAQGLLQLSIDSLLKCNSRLKLEIVENDKRIAEFRERAVLIALNKTQVNSVPVVLNSPVKILNDRFVLGDTIAVAKKLDTILVIGYASDYFTAKYRNKTGFVHYYALPMSDDLINFKDLALRNMLINEQDAEKKVIIQHEINVFNKQRIDFSNQKIEGAKELERKKTEQEALKKQTAMDAELQRKRKALNAEQQKKRKIDIFNRYGQVVGQKILDGKIWIGMTKEMAEESWGVPSDINRTVNQYKVHEQWVYSSRYLYFDDGILTSWQD